MWIEIRENLDKDTDIESQPARAVWIEMQWVGEASAHLPSQPARAVWIEIDVCPKCHGTGWVTACEGCVD